jgi:hypothetical protein
MKYKVQTLIVDSFGNVDIPEGWIPLNFIEKIVSTLSGGTTCGGTYKQRELIVLEPVG